LPLADASSELDFYLAYCGFDRCRNRFVLAGKIPKVNPPFPFIP
jgi:hypothetical protein